MNIVKSVVIVFLLVCSLGTLACNIPEGKAYPSLLVDGGAIVFDLAPIENESEGSSGGDLLGIDVNYFNCLNSQKQLIDQLPFLADTGIVRAAFFADAEQDTAKELFIIHSVTIRSDTGVKYSGDYYTVQVYRASSEGYTKDKRLSSYFGYGGDVLADDYRNFLYVFPYKDQAAIFDKLNSKSYKSWNSGSPVELVINQKTLIYSSPVLADITHMYLVTGDKIRQEGVQGGWISIVYRSKKGKDIRGWIQCSNAGGC